jgi:hypothetical protein
VLLEADELAAGESAIAQLRLNRRWSRIREIESCCAVFARARR